MDIEAKRGLSAVESNQYERLPCFVVDFCHIVAQING